jgi:MFS family permease
MAISRRPQSIQNIYLYLVLGNTLAASFIWGINTLFLLDAGLTNFQAFLANAFFTLGQVLFEIPTGIVADTFGRRRSYLLGALTLAISTLIYLVMWQIQGPFWGWALSSILLGLGFTFFSGAVEAWLVDALAATGFEGELDSVFAKGQVVGGIAMLGGSVAGGVLAQLTNLGVPYMLRVVVLLLNFATAFFLMKDLGFTPRKTDQPIQEMKNIFNDSVQYGLGNPPIRWLMLAASLTAGVSFYTFYALQPFLLQLWGDEQAYGIAGVVAAIAALAQIAGGIFAPRLRAWFSRRTSVLFMGITLTGLILLLVSFVSNFWVALVLIFVWGLIFAALMPIRQAYINGLIPSSHRATVLSFDSLIASSGGIVTQPALGRVADAYSYSSSYLMAAIIQTCALPFIWLARKEHASSDYMTGEGGEIPQP